MEQFQTEILGFWFGELAYNLVVYLQGKEGCNRLDARPVGWVGGWVGGCGLECLEQVG